MIKEIFIDHLDLRGLKRCNLDEILWYIYSHKKEFGLLS